MSEDLARYDTGTVEKAVLGTVMLTKGKLLDQVIDSGICAGDFSRHCYGLVFESMLRLRDQEIVIDFPTILQDMQERETIDRAGGVAWLASLIDDVVGPDISHYLTTIRRGADVRHLQAVCAKAATTLGDEPWELEQVKEELASALIKNTPSGFARARDVMVSHLQRLENGEFITGLASGVNDLDAMTSGLQRGEMMVVAGRPSAGKSSFALSVAEYISRKEQNIVAFFSLEMSVQNLAEKLLARGSRINSRTVHSGSRYWRREDEWRRLAETAIGMSESLWICDQGSLSATQLKARSEKLALQTNGVDLIVVDFLQLMQGASGKRSDYEIVSDNVRRLKTTAKELNASMLVLSQLSREVEKRSDEEPKLSDLRSSGEIEQVADQVVLLWESKDERESREEGQRAAGPVRALLAKNRNGSIGRFDLFYDRTISHFEPLARTA